MNAKQTTISETQKAILMQAAHRAGKIVLPENLKGGARNTVLNALERRSLIVPHDEEWKMSLAGYDAINQPHPKDEMVSAPIPEKVAPVVEPISQENKETKPVKLRAESKQSTVIELLKSEFGVTNAEICKKTGWQTHTVRGMLSGTLGKKLGLVVLSHKERGQERVYYIPTPEQLAALELAKQKAE